MTDQANAAPPGAASAAAGAGSPHAAATDDLVQQFGLYDVLNEMRTSKQRSSFSHYISELPTDKVPLRPRCPAGLLLPLVTGPVNEDVRRLDDFDESVVRAALTLKEGPPGEKIPMPDWLDEEQAWGDGDAARRRKRREKKKKKKKKKRKRGDDDDKHDDDDKRQRKKRK